MLPVSNKDVMARRRENPYRLQSISPCPLTFSQMNTGGRIFIFTIWNIKLNIVSKEKKRHNVPKAELCGIVQNQPATSALNHILFMSTCTVIMLQYLDYVLFKF